MTTTPEVSSRAVARPRFKVSLRTLLIALVALGAGSGLLGRLFMTQPRVALAVVGALSTIVPFTLAVGTIFWIGVRDKRAGLVLWCGCLIAMPVIGWLVMFFGQRTVGTSRGDLAVQNTQLLIEQRLPNQWDQPGIWDEFERRIQSKSLTAEQANEALGVLIAQMKTNKPSGWDQPMHWQGDFIQAAAQAGLVSDTVRYEFLDAFHGSKPIVSLPRVREGGRLNIDVKYGSNWAEHSGFDVALVWEVTQVLLDGKPVEFQPSRMGSERWRCRYEGDLVAGESTLSVEVEAAYIDLDRLIGLNVRDLPMRSWPQAGKRWKQTVSVPLRIYSADDTIVALSMAPESDPRNAIKAERLVAQADPKGGTRLVLKFEVTRRLSIPISFDVAVKAGEQTHSIGALWVVQQDGGTSTGGSTLQKRIEEISPDIGVCDLILTPNPKYVERLPGADEIWGQPITIRHVPLERLDIGVEHEQP